MARIVLFGSTGQLGSDLARELSGHELDAYGPDDLDVTDARAVASRFASREAEWIINATAYNDVGAAEENPLPAFAVNAAAVAILARQARQVGARFVHFSTDYVFSGEKGAAYVENDPPCPQNVYAVSKLAGEALAMRAGTWFIFRLSALFGTTGCRTKGGGNFVEKILEQAQAGRTLQVVEDAVCTPTFSLDVARFLRDRLFSLAPGLYHLANAGPCSWFEFAREILSQAGMADTPVVGIKRQGPVPVPANSALASEKLPPLRPWREALSEYLALRGPQGSSPTNPIRPDRRNSP